LLPAFLFPHLRIQSNVGALFRPLPWWQALLHFSCVLRRTAKLYSTLWKCGVHVSVVTLARSTVSWFVVSMSLSRFSFIHPSHPIFIVDRRRSQSHHNVNSYSQTQLHLGPRLRYGHICGLETAFMVHRGRCHLSITCLNRVTGARW